MLWAVAFAEFAISEGDWVIVWLQAAIPIVAASPRVAKRASVVRDEVVWVIDQSFVWKESEVAGAHGKGAPQPLAVRVRE